MDITAPISPPEFRLFFNRFIRVNKFIQEIRIPNEAEFYEEVNRIGSIIGDLIKKGGLSPVQECRLLDDLGTISLIKSFEEGKDQDIIWADSIGFQNRCLKQLNIFHSGGAWKRAAQVHPLVHCMVTHWRGMHHGPPLPIELKSEQDIANYLLLMSGKCPSIVDSVRLDGVLKFIAKPVIVVDEATTWRILGNFQKHWFSGGMPKMKVIEPKEIFSMKKIVPEQTFADIPM